MIRIICDICGCEYEETLEICPVCGYPRQGTEKTAVAATSVDRTKVKGGRFSSKNVKKRKKAMHKAAAAAAPVKRVRSDKPLLIVIALLLVAIVLVSLYIAQRFIWGSGNAFVSNREHNLPATTAPVVTTEAPTVPCAGILLDTSVIALDAPGQTHKLELTIMPENTSDELTIVSADEAVVRVDEDGMLTAVGPGQAEITVTCGSVEKSCTVVCWFGEEITAPVETTVPPETAAPTEAPKPTEPKETEAPVLKLDPSDASCFSINEVFTIYARLGSSTVNRSEVTWITSDPNIATVEDGIVTPVSKGIATITAEYENMEATCTVRCRFENPTNQEQQDNQQEQENQENLGNQENQENQENPENQDNQENPTNQTWKASHSDVSISVGEPFQLTVKNSAGETADAIWTMSIDGVVSVDGKTITGRAPGMVTLTTDVEGTIFTCIIRVR